MIRQFKKLSLERQLFVSFLSISICMLVLSLGTTLSVSVKRQQEDIDRHISGAAAYIASMDQVKTMLEIGYPSDTAQKELDSLHHTLSDLDIVAIYDANGLRFYHTDRQETGETVMEGDEAAILAGSEPYITTGSGTMGNQRRAFHAVTDSDGSIIGFVMASVFSTYIEDQAKTLFPVYLLILCVMLLFSILLSHGIVKLLRGSLMGHHPEELLDLYLKQDTVLNAMDDGIIASDQNGTIIFINQTARNLFPADTEFTGLPLKHLFPMTSAGDILIEGTPIYQRSCQLAGHSLIYSEIPVGAKPNIQGVLTLLNDRSEVEALSDELSGAKSMLDTLRAFNHEFLNKLHVILGYLQTGNTEQAISFITNSTLVSSQAIRQTADCLRVSQICALVIGKKMHAAELGIVLSVNPDSRCMPKDLILPIDSYITIIGNLLENAIEELSACEKEMKEINLGVYLSQDCTIITCEDTGGGIPDPLLPHIYDLGVSSKGENRGTGLFLIHQIVRQYNGDIHIETEPGEGTCLTITFTQKGES